MDVLIALRNIGGYSSHQKTKKINNKRKHYSKKSRKQKKSKKSKRNRRRK